MKIVFQRDVFFNALFPQAATDHEIKELLTNYYTVEGKKPKIDIHESWISVEVDFGESVPDKELQAAIHHCEQGRFHDAIRLLTQLIANNPSNSELHRLLGQAYSEVGENEEAINHLIDALRWDSSNAYALMMMGNIYIKHKGDIQTAKIYYNQALENNPNDHITLSNIGAALLNEEKLADAKEYLSRSIAQSSYPNALYMLGTIVSKEGNLSESFDYHLQAIKGLSSREQLYQYVHQEMLRIAMEISEGPLGNDIVQQYKEQLEARGQKNILIEGDEDIPFAAKIEFAENYNRTYHRIKYKRSRKGVAHLIMHELVHLELVLDARAEGLNMHFTSNTEGKSRFRKDLSIYLNNLKRKGIVGDKVDGLIDTLFNGFNSLIYNAPIDLFIENFLFNRFPALRPFQFVSLSQLISEGIYSVTNKDLKELAPPAILSKTKIYNIVAAFQFRDLFGVDVVKDYQASKLEIETATEFYKEFIEYRDDKGPAEEYELIQHWAEDLQVDSYFKLILENAGEEKDIDDVLNDIAKDPLNLTESAAESEEMQKFLDSHRDTDVNLAVVTYMIEALQYFKDKPKERIKEVAFEIAMQGRQGYNPNGESYKLATISNKTFSGYHILAYYYVSWALALPEMLKELGLPFEKEYQLATNFK